MDKIASFTVNHLDLIPGVYVSRKDYVGKEVIIAIGIYRTATGDYWKQLVLRAIRFAPQKSKDGTGCPAPLSQVWKNGS